MNNKFLIIGITKFLFLGVLAGCASAPGIDDDKSIGAGLNDESLDLLFATEFPVASEADAMGRAARSLHEGKVDEALFFYVRALQFRPENVDLLAHIGEIQMQRNNSVMAKRAFLMAKEYDPTHTRSLEGLGLIYMAEGMDSQAISELKAAVANNELLWRAHNALGVYADKAEDFATAQSHYDSALLINPDAAHVLNNRGYSKFLSGDIDGAAMDLYEAAFDRGFPQAWANLGRVYAKQGWYDDAVMTYKNVMSEANAFNVTGNAAIENVDFLQAEHFLLEAIRLSPTYFPAAEENLSKLAELQ